MDSYSEKMEAEKQYAQLYSTRLETGGFVPMRMQSSTHLKVPLLITIPRSSRAQRIQRIDEESQRLLSEYEPSLQWATLIMMMTGMLVVAWVMYTAVLASAARIP